jgi:hypothetical protein
MVHDASENNLNSDTFAKDSKVFFTNYMIEEVLNRV